MSKRRREYKKRKGLLKNIAIMCFALLLLTNVISFNVDADNNFIKHQSKQINYTKIALDYVEENYPNKTYEVVSNTTVIPYRETGISYEYVVIDIIPGENSLEDTVGVTVRHDTLNTEFGQEQYMKDYDEFISTLHPCFERMSSLLRSHITSQIGLLSAEGHSYNKYYDVNIVTTSNQYEVTEHMKSQHIRMNIKSTNLDSTIISATLNFFDLMTVANMACVKQIELNCEIQMVPQLMWSGPYIGASELHNGFNGNIYLGNDSIVGILDSGVGVELNDDNSIHPAIEYKNGGMLRGLIDRKDFTGTTIKDDIGHGTHIAGIIGSNGHGEVGQPTELTQNIGIAPNAQMVSAKACVVPDTPPNILSQYKDSLNWMVNEGPPANVPDLVDWRKGVDVLQTSLMVNDTSTYTFDGSSEFSLFTDYIIQNRGVPFAVAAGNDGHQDNIIGTPGDAYNVITVGAIEDVATFSPRVAYYSCFGDTADGRQGIEIVAPGTHINSTATLWHGGPQGLDYWLKWGNGYSEGFDFVMSNGTSMAAPHVSGTMALMNYKLKDMPGGSLLAKSILLNSAEKLDGWDSTDVTKPLDDKQGAGLLDATEAISTLENNNRYDVYTFDAVTPEERYYHFRIDTVPTYFTATTTWNRHVTIDNAGTLNALGLNNLDMKLYQTYNGGVLSSIMSESRSPIDNVEHIYYEITEPGTYAIEIDPIDLISGNEHIFAVAFSHEYINKGNELDIDKTPPNSKVGTGDVYWKTMPSLDITATATDDFSGVSSVELYYRYSIDNSTWGSWTSFGSDSTSTYEWNFGWPPGDGYYQFYSIAVDNAGNYEVAPTNPDFDVGYGYDVTPPTAPDFISHGGDCDDPGSTTDHTPTLDWGTSNEPVSGVQYYQLLVDDSSNFESPLINIQTSPDTTLYTPGSSMSDDTYYWKVKAVDNAGNVGEWSNPSWSFTVEPVPQFGNVGGHVYTSSGTPISSAMVALVSVPTGGPGSGPSILSSVGGNTICTSTFTGADGSWSMTVPSGPQDLTASKIDYYSQTLSTTVPASGTALLNFYLTKPTDDGDGCFVEGTKIATPNGNVNIEDVTTGIDVLTYNENTGNIETNKVLQTFSHSAPEYLLINYLKVTENHPIYVNGEIMRADAIQVGDIMTGLDGEVEVTRIERIIGSQDVYNLEVDGNHNYFADGILVHNKGDVSDDPDPDPGGPWDTGGCPFVYSWGGTDYVEDNNILPLSTLPDRDGLDVTDYYMLETEADPKDGNYSFLIQEDQTYRTHLDEMELAVVDYPDGYEIGITPEGDWVTYSTAAVAPISAVNSSGSDVLARVQYDDLTYRQYQMDDYIILNFGNLEDITEAKLIVKRKSLYPPNESPQENPPSWWWMKHPINIQINESGEWVTIKILPTRVNWATGVVNLTSISYYLENGGDIRLLITGGIRDIDYVGLDISETQEIDVNYYSPTYASSDVEDTNIVNEILNKDGNYMILNPFRSIEIIFPYESPTLAQRALTLISTGHYYSFPEVDIEQPVQIRASIEGGSEGSVSLWLQEVVDSATVLPLQGLSVELSNNSQDELKLSFVQNPRTRYRLSARFENCNEETTITIEATSFRGTRGIEIGHVPTRPVQIKTYPLDDILWNITGVSFDKFSGRFQVLNNTLLQFDLNQYYNTEFLNNSEYKWNFDDGTWTNDIRPTHIYDRSDNYTFSLLVKNATEDGLAFIASAGIDVIPLSPPTPIIDIYQEVDVTLRVAGREDNSVTLQIYENGTLINEETVTRQSGNPNNQAKTITVNEYIERNYTYILVYEVNHKGANPTWVTFTSGDNVEEFFYNFKTKDGTYQTVNVIISTQFNEGNYQYVFDASGSYDIDGDIIFYEWDFDDGSLATGEQVEHTFAETGTYEVKLKVTDDDGAVAIVTKEILLQ